MQLLLVITISLIALDNCLAWDIEKDHKEEHYYNDDFHAESPLASFGFKIGGLKAYFSIAADLSDLQVKPEVDQKLQMAARHILETFGFYEPNKQGPHQMDYEEYGTKGSAELESTLSIPSQDGIPIVSAEDEVGRRSLILPSVPQVLSLGTDVPVPTVSVPVPTVGDVPTKRPRKERKKKAHAKYWKHVLGDIGHLHAN